MLAGDLYGIFVSFDHINYRAGVMTFAFAGQVRPEAFVDTWRKFKINVVQAIPTVLVPLLRQAKQLEPDLKIPKIIYAGTPLSGSDREWLKREVGTQRIASIIGANDGGQLAFQCEHMTGGRHHLIDDFNYVEIVDEKGKPVSHGEPGRIVITSLLKYAFPLIRYELGDAGRIVREPCACGRTARVIEYLGRSDDTVCIANMNVRYRDFLSALSGYDFSAMQLSARNSEKGEWLVMRVESDYSEQGIEKKVRETLLEKVENLRGRIADKSLLKLDVEWLAPGALPRNPRSGKIRTLVDERA
jgi:phenylacetate-CoA ligase